MSNITEEDMEKMMRPGLRVLRGKDWDQKRGDLDANGPGTVLGNKNVRPGWWTVKWDNIGVSVMPWDNGVVHNHRMGAEGKYELMIIDFVKPIP